jgi:hypothetical protein
MSFVHFVVKGTTDVQSFKRMDLFWSYMYWRIYFTWKWLQNLLPSTKHFFMSLNMGKAKEKYFHNNTELYTYYTQNILEY